MPEAGRAGLEDLAASVWDVLVIGGGIVGAGVARDAAGRGLRVLLVEQADFASGTSSRSSRLLHGGLRYLAQGRLGLVREASVEKMLLSRLAPHLCQPLPFVFPVWRGSAWKRWHLAAGVRLYDLLCGRRNLGPSSVLGPEEALRAVPGLRREGLVGATRHFDALTADARLVLDTLRAAAVDGAVVCNWTSYREGRPGAGGWVGTLRDEQTGGTVEVRAQVVVNAAGAWAGRLGPGGLRLRLTKGVHLVLDRARLPVAEAVILTEGRRILFVIPWGERIILGTTDTDYAGDPAAVCTEPGDVAYLLGVVNEAFPGAGLGTGDVLSTWAGVRPLVAPRRAEAGAPSDVSRGHVLHAAAPGWLDVAGGKLTTYRLMAEEAVDRVGAMLGRRLPRSGTAARPLPPGAGSGVLPPPVEQAVVTECCQQEWAVHLDDVLLRRTSWHYYHGGQDGLAERVAGWMAAVKGWDDERRARELARYRAAVTAGDAGK